MPTHEPGRYFPETDVMENFEVDPSGDFFGDYEDYNPEEFGIGPEEDAYEENDDNDEEEEGNDANEPSLEPERLPNPLMSDSNDIEVSDGAIQAANRLRGGAEAELNNKPHVVRFRGKAGAVYTDQDCIDGNTSYTSQINNPDNPFSPFSSQIEWEIAHWAKTQGPSSTAFTELMSIEGVSNINLCTQLGSNHDLTCNLGP